LDFLIWNKGNFENLKIDMVKVKIIWCMRVVLKILKIDMVEVKIDMVQEEFAYF